MTRQIPIYTPSGVPSLSSQPDQTSIGEEYQHQIGEDAAPPMGVETHLRGRSCCFTALDKQMAQPDTAQRSVSPPVNTLHDPDPMLTQSEPRQGTPVTRVPQPFKSPTHTQEPKKQPIPPPIGEDVYPDLYLPVAENYKISDMFYGYTGSVSADNNPMILVELNGLSYKYGPTVYVVDRVNGTMYGRFNGDFRVISERATLEPQYINTPLVGIYEPKCTTHTLPGQTQLVIPLAKSTPVTQSSQTP